MEEMSAFERQLAARLQHMAGPEPFVDVTASVRAATTAAPKTRLLTMFGATRFVLAGAIVALFGGLLLAGLLSQQVDERLPAPGASASPSPEASYVVTRATDYGEADGAWNLISTDEARWWAHGDTVSRTDVVTGEVTTVPLPSSARGLVSSDDAIWAVGEDALHRIDRVSLTVTDSIDAPGGAFCSHPEFGPEPHVAVGSLWTLAHRGGESSLVEIDLATNAIRGEYPTGDTSATEPCGPWMDVISDAIWMGSGEAAQLIRFDLGRRTFTDRIDLPGSAEEGDDRGCCVAVDDAIWISQGRDLRRFDLATLEITDTHDIGRELGGGSVKGGVAAAGAIWISATGGVLRVDLATREVTDFIKVGRFSERPVFWRGAIWVSHTQPDGVSRIDVATRHVTESVAIAGQPRTPVPDGDVLWVPTDMAGWSRIDAVPATE